MSENDRSLVLSVAAVTEVRLIDGGDTIALSFLTPDGREVAVLVPREPASALQTQLVTVLGEPRRDSGKAN